MVALVREMPKSGKVATIICYDGWLLCSAGVVEGRKATCLTAIKDDMIHADAKYVDEEVAVDGNLTVSRKPTDLPVFCRQTVRARCGQDLAQHPAKG
jgi:deglycase